MNIINSKKKKQEETERIKKRPNCDGLVKKYSLNYNLSFDELFEAISMLVDKKSKKSRMIMGCVLFLAAVSCVILYAFQPYGIQYAFSALILGVFACLVMGYPTFKGKINARKICKQKGIYKVTFTTDGYIAPYGEKAHDLWADSKCCAYESDFIFALRADRTHSFCIPKRVLTPTQINQTRQMFKTYSSNYIDKSKRQI